MGFFPPERMGYAKSKAAQTSKQLQDEERIRSAAFDKQIERGLASGQLAAPAAYRAGLPYHRQRAGVAGSAFAPELGLELSRARRGAAADSRVERHNGDAGFDRGALYDPLRNNGSRTPSGGGRRASSLTQSQPSRRDACTIAWDRLATGEDFNKACTNHDRCYATPGAHKGSCDVRLHSEMSEACDRPNSRAQCEHVADQYYRGVHRFGGPFYLFEQWRARNRR